MADNKSNKNKKTLTPFGKYLDKKGYVQSVVLEKTGLNQLQLDNLRENEKASLYASIFNAAIRAIVNDDDTEFDDACDFVFKGVKIPEYKKEIEEDPSLSDFGNYIQQFIVEKQDLANKIGLKPAKFSKLVLKKYNKTPLGSDVYILAKVHGLRPSVVFRDLYGLKDVDKI